MRYQKPTVMELGNRARRAAGKSPQGCVSGPAAGEYETCGTGASAGWSCVSGDRPGSFPGCAPGSAAGGGGDCLSGSSVSYYCEAGAGGDDDPYGCVSGPSYT